MAARNFESAGDFERAAECLLKLNRYSEVLDLIARYKELIQREQNHIILKHLRFDQRDESICYQAAKFYQHRGDYQAMTDALEKLPIVEDRINFLQRNGFFDQAAELLLKEGKAQEAAWLMRSKGKFLEAARYSAGDKFIADCYLLAAQSTIKEENRNKETEEFISGLLETATEMYKRCNNLNGEAEVLFARGKYFKNSALIDDAGKLYYRATNYAALTDCLLLLMEHEKDPRKFSRAKAVDTLRGLLHLIFALHKDKKENSEHTAIAMCHVYFGIEDTDNVLVKKVPLEEKVRFTNLRDVHAKLTHDGVISAKDADMLIKDQLSRMATKLIKQLWNKHQQINDRCKSCPHFLAGASCDRTICIRHHAGPSAALFRDRFYALLFLIRLEETIASFLKNMQRESAKVKKQLEQKLFIEPEFTACEWLYDLLFPRDGQHVSSYFMSERDLNSLRSRIVSVRVKEFAERFLWYRSGEIERWSSSDLFIQVYNMMHVAGIPVEKLLCVEERKFEARNLPSHPGMFPDNRRPGRFEIFSKSLERSKTKLYGNGDVLGSIHAAVRKFLFAPAKRRGLPYPSIANAVMILERQVTACLMLYTRLVMNETFICLPESYLSMINFWDFVERSQTNRSTTFYDAIQYAAYFFQGVEGQKSFNHLQELATDLVKLTFGEVSRKYNVVVDALCGNSVNCVEAERVLVLVLIMLCNCGRGIPKECEKLIREHLITLHLRQDLPEPLKKCVEDVRNATGFTDVVLCLRELLDRRPRQEKLCDVKWDDRKVKDSRRVCEIENYSKHFCFQIDVIKLSSEVSQRKQDKGHEVTEVADDEMNDNYSQVLNEDETDNQREEYNDEAKGKASIIIQRAFSKWKFRKKAKDTLDEEIKNDPVKCHFQSFKLDKSGCTICAPVQFGDRSLSSTDTVSDPSSSTHHEEETKSTWQLLHQNTFESHCSKGSLHWKNEKWLKKFKEFYEKRIVPTLKRGTQLKEEMTKLNEETEVNCELDLHRLDDALSRLQNTIKKIEGERAWHSVWSIEKAADEVDTQTKKISNTKNKKGNTYMYISRVYLVFVYPI